MSHGRWSSWVHPTDSARWYWGAPPSGAGADAINSQRELPVSCIQNRPLVVSGDGRRGRFHCRCDSVRGVGHRIIPGEEVHLRKHALWTMDDGEVVTEELEM